jgi:hypothetical protein
MKQVVSFPPYKQKAGDLEEERGVTLIATPQL